MTKVKCIHCKRHVRELKDEITTIEPGVMVQIKNACSDCVSILKSHIKKFEKFKWN